MATTSESTICDIISSTVFIKENLCGKFMLTLEVVCFVTF